MFSLVLILHIVICIMLIFIILLQRGRGAEMGAAFGGASQTLFGAAGPTTFLNKLTTFLAILFMITSLGLAYLSGHQKEKSIVNKPAVTIPQKQIPAKKAPVKSPK